MAYWKICTGRAAIGSFSRHPQYGFTKAVKRSGAVSPAMRASDTRTPVRMPLRAAGRTTPRVVRQRVKPSARAPSLISRGTRRTISSVVRVTMGRSMMASASPPASAEKCPMDTTTHAHTKIPITMDGIPFITSVRKRTAFARRLPCASAR